jgi:hypothetical protein
VSGCGRTRNEAVGGALARVRPGEEQLRQGGRDLVRGEHGFDHGGTGLGDLDGRRGIALRGRLKESPAVLEEVDEEHVAPPPSLITGRRGARKVSWVKQWAANNGIL